MYGPVASTVPERSDTISGWWNAISFEPGNRSFLYGEGVELAICRAERHWFQESAPLRWHAEDLVSQRSRAAKSKLAVTIPRPLWWTEFVLRRQALAHAHRDRSELRLDTRGDLKRRVCRSAVSESSVVDCEPRGGGSRPRGCRLGSARSIIPSMAGEETASE